MGREQALQALYSVEVGHRDPGDAISEVVGEGASSEHRAFVRDLVLGTIESMALTDATISPLLQDWTIDRLPTIDRLALRMGAYELLLRPQTPAAVAINEAVELVKKFSTEESGRFVNGVLSAISREHAKA